MIFPPNRIYSSLAMAVFFFSALAGEAVSAVRQAEMEKIAPDAIAVDGKLNEPVCQQGAWQSDFTTLTTGERAPLQTKFRIFTDGARFYFSAQTEEPGGNALGAILDPHMSGKLPTRHPALFHFVENDFLLPTRGSHPAHRVHFENFCCFVHNHRNEMYDTYDALRQRRYA